MFYILTKNNGSTTLTQKTMLEHIVSHGRNPGSDEFVLSRKFLCNIPGCSPEKYNYLCLFIFCADHHARSMKTAKYLSHLHNVHYFPILSCLQDHDHISDSELHLTKGLIYYAADMKLIANLSGDFPVTVAIADTCRRGPAAKQAAAKLKQAYAHSGSESQAEDVSEDN
jgi:hypothetical protein